MSLKHDSDMNSYYNNFIHSEVHMELSITLYFVGQLNCYCLYLRIIKSKVSFQILNSIGTVSHTSKQKYFNDIVKSSFIPTQRF